MKVFTVRNGSVSEGAKVERFALKGAGVEIDAVVVGEEGRGRERGILPVQGQTTDGWVDFATVGQTKADKPKLISQAEAGDLSACLVVFRTKGGYRGGAEHTAAVERWRAEHQYAVPREGGAVGVEWKWEKISGVKDEVRAWARERGLKEIIRYGHMDFPGEVICRGVIAQGDAGRMGHNEQIVAVVPKGVWFRTAYTGRLYGEPDAHFYVFDGERLIAVTEEEYQGSEEAA